MGDEWPAHSLPEDNHGFSFALTTPSVGVLPEKIRRDPILCLKLEWIDDIQNSHFISLKKQVSSY